MRQDLLKTAHPPDSRDLVEDDQEVGSERLDRPDPTGLKGSRHARLSDQIQAPDDDLSLDEAGTLCGEVTRAWLGDFAPALMLLDAEPRRRLQAVLTLTRIAIDFALQPGVEGERVSALNRLQFEVEAALDGDPRGQPAHLLIAEQERHKPWRRKSWDDYFDRVRHLAMAGPSDLTLLRRVAGAATELVAPPNEDLRTAAATMLIRAERWRFESDGARDPARGTEAQSQSASSMSGTVAIDSAPWRRFVSYVRRAERKLSSREARGRPAKLGLIARLGLLARSRFG